MLNVETSDVKAGRGEYMNMIRRMIASVGDKDKSHVSLPAHAIYVSKLIPQVNKYDLSVLKCGMLPDA